MNFRQTIANLINPTRKNSVGGELAQAYWRYGPQQHLSAPDWSQIWLDEKDKYSGFLYGAIQRRANAVAHLATHNLLTAANDATTAAAKKAKTNLVHPYLTLVDESPLFSNERFFREIQTFLDVKGDYYLMVIRGGGIDEKVSSPTEFKLLRPYEITVVWDEHELEPIGYIQTRLGASREIPPWMIIPMRQFNPFNHKLPYSTADAAKSSQFGLREIGEHVITTSRRNRKYPGVVAIGANGVTLDSDQVRNFKERLIGKSGSDEPLFVNSGGAQGGINWTDLQIDIRKSAVDILTESQLKELVAVTGTSKTKLGIEESGVTRDSAAIQNDLFIVDQAMPALQIIVDSLNQDYKRYYPDEYKKYGYRMWIDNPLPEDKDAKIADTTNRTNMYALYEDLVDAGYDSDIAAAYATGEKDLNELGMPTNPPKPATALPPAPAAPSVELPIEEALGAHHDHVVKRVMNALPNNSRATISQQQAGLQSAVRGLDQQVVAAALATLGQSGYTANTPLVKKQQRQKLQHDLEEALAVFYGIVTQLIGNSTVSDRIKEYGRLATFRVDEEVNRYIDETAGKVAESHLGTILTQLENTVEQTINQIVDTQLKADGTDRAAASDAVVARARELAVTGANKQQIVSALTQEFSDSISTSRAETVARTETARAFNQAQFAADRQFLAQNNLTAQAYKVWHTNSPNPCPYCTSLADMGPIPFAQSFADVGDTLQGSFSLTGGGTSVRMMSVSFESVQAGNLHPNCQCDYELIIQL
jgi:hypothetical protein